MSICLLMSQLIVVRESDMRKGKIIDVLDAQMNKVTGYYNEVIALEDQTKKFRHDIKNLFLILRAMIEKGEDGKALQYLDKMSDLCKQTKNRYDTGNFVADTLLSAKATVAETMQTEILFQGCIPVEIENVDLVILLANLLDNALEACEQIAGKKTVTIDSVLQKHLWILVVKNPSEREVRIKHNWIATTKSNKQIHGFGIQNVERVAQKYNGSLALACKEKIFTASVMLQL